VWACEGVLTGFRAGRVDCDAVNVRVGRVGVLGDGAVERLPSEDCRGESVRKTVVCDPVVQGFERRKVKSGETVKGHWEKRGAMTIRNSSRRTGREKKK